MRIACRLGITVVAHLPLAGSVMAADLPGQRVDIGIADLPPPYATASVSNSPDVVDRPAEAALQVPQGFVATLFADRLGNARNLAVAPNGDVFLVGSAEGRILVLRDDGKGRALRPEVFADGLDAPSGIAFQDGALYIADLRAVWRYPYRAGDVRPSGAATQVTPPGALGSPNGHDTRNLAFAPDGKSFFVAVGSRGNVDEEAPPRATVTAFRADGSGGQVFASGLRNPVGIGFRPGSTDLYVAVNERDGLGDGLVPDFFTRLQQGGFYGWPYSYIGQHPEPRLHGKHPELVAKAIVPDVLFRSHSAPLGLAFYEGRQFPADYHGDAFVTLHGSWNASVPTGYEIVRIKFRDGRPAGGYEIFATGFRVGGDTTARVWGRPVGIVVARDGSLLVADDTGGTVWRISYTEK
ncbi:MAG: sorbosone dehydrogenase [Rhodospirillales bacterium]|nr:sorbosone dehydrogenase [Rhodospirillales bacterium]